MDALFTELFSQYMLSNLNMMETFFKFTSVNMFEKQENFTAIKLSFQRLREALRKITLVNLF